MPQYRSERWYRLIRVTRSEGSVPESLPSGVLDVEVVTVLVPTLYFPLVLDGVGPSSPP